MRFQFCMFVVICAISVLTAAAQDDKAIPQPTLISAPTPVYPSEAKEAGIGGRITVRVVVDETGAVVSVDEPTGPPKICGARENDPRILALREAVVEAIKKAKFSPAMKDGKPVRSTVFIGSTFNPLDKQTRDPRPKMISAGVLNGKALRLPKPAYPFEAHAAGAAGAVTVQVLISETGEVLTAQAVSGHPLLRSASVDSACKAKFSPTTLDGKPVRLSGVITYNFVP